MFMFKVKSLLLVNVIIYLSYSDYISSVTIKSLADASPLVAIINEELVFTAIVTAGTNYYTPVTYHWNFGNGHTETSTEPSITYSYSTPGSWNVTLTATNNVSGVTFSGTVQVYKGWFSCA